MVIDVYRLHSYTCMAQRFFYHFSSMTAMFTNITPGMRPIKIKIKFRVEKNTSRQMILFVAIDVWQEIPYKCKDRNRFASLRALKTIFYLSNIKRKVPQIFSLFPLVICPSSSMLFYIHSSRNVGFNGTYLISMCAVYTTSG